MEESNSAFVRLLGPVRVLDADGTAIRLSGRRTAALVARLALSAGVVVPAETLLDDIWEDDIPDGGTETLRRLASRTRSRLAKHRLAVGPVPNGGGYRFVIEPMRVDAHRFDDEPVTAAVGDGPDGKTVLCEPRSRPRGQPTERLGTAVGDIVFPDVVKQRLRRYDDPCRKRQARD